jgi:hypothetical protein
VRDWQGSEVRLLWNHRRSIRILHTDLFTVKRWQVSEYYFSTYTFASLPQTALKMKIQQLAAGSIQLLCRNG